MDNAAKKGNQTIKTIIIAVLAIILGATGGYFGYHWWSKNQMASAGANPAVEQPVTPVFMPLEPFTVNLVTQDQDLSHVLYVGITLRLPDEKTKVRLTEYLPEVRSRLLLLLARHTSADLVTEAGKQQLVNEIKQALGQTLINGQPNQVINDVLFTAFILR